MIFEFIKNFFIKKKKVILVFYIAEVILGS